MESPLGKFERWWQAALADSPLKQKSAVCISTIDENGFPTGRFVDLKSVNESGFVFCTYFDSAKGKQLQHDSKTAMTVWWDHVGYQVRISGNAEVITAAEADRFWNTRSRSAQLTTTAFEQSTPMATENYLVARLQEATEKITDRNIPRPVNWGGYCVRPVSIEFLTFQESRLHLRELFERKGNEWTKRLLQP